MTNFDYVQKTIDLFEESLGSPTPCSAVGELARRIGYSAHHLGRLFQSLCGMPLGQYMLKRRLSEAVRMMTDEGASASAAAGRLGWEDYSSFSRAFRKEFGAGPGRLKSLEPEALTLVPRARPRLPDDRGRGELQPVLLHAGELHVTGLVFFMGPNEKTFHRPWRIFSRHADRIRGRMGPGTYQFSAWTGEPSGPDGGIWIHCAAQTERGVQQEPVFFSRTVPASRILRFLHAGPVEHLYDTYRRIWDEYLPRSTFKLSGNWEYQHYPEPDDPGRIEVCLPVEERL